MFRRDEVETELKYNDFCEAKIGEELRKNPYQARSTINIKNKSLSIIIHL